MTLVHFLMIPQHILRSTQPQNDPLWSEPTSQAFCITENMIVSARGVKVIISNPTQWVQSFHIQESVESPMFLVFRSCGPCPRQSVGGQHENTCVGSQPGSSRVLPWSVWPGPTRPGSSGSKTSPGWSDSLLEFSSSSDKSIQTLTESSAVLISEHDALTRVSSSKLFPQ